MALLLRGSLDTSRPTPPDRPTIIQYDVTDASGNAALPAQRHLTVACPQGERVCGEEGSSGLDGDGGSELTCSVGGGMCVSGFTQAFTSAVAMEPSTDSTTSVAGGTVSTVTASSQNVTAVTATSVTALPGSTTAVAAATRTAPLLRLVGPEVVQVQQYTTYAACTASSDYGSAGSTVGSSGDVQAPCDGGARAWDDVDGDLGNKVVACHKPPQVCACLCMLLACTQR